jgi:hypothetical protein
MKTEFKSAVANIYVRWRGPAPEGAGSGWPDRGRCRRPGGANFIIDETESVRRPGCDSAVTLGPPMASRRKVSREFHVNDEPGDDTGYNC